MDRLRTLLLTFNGRIGRGKFWLGVFCLFVAGVALSALAIAVGMGETEVREGYSVINGERSEISGFRTSTSPLASLVISILLTAPWLAVAIKRRHDRGSNGYDVVGFTALNLLLQILSVLGVGGALQVVLVVVVIVWGVVLLILLGFLKGEDGTNAYGPNPLVVAST